MGKFEWGVDRGDNGVGQGGRGLRRVNYFIHFFIYFFFFPILLNFENTNFVNRVGLGCGGCHFFVVGGGIGNFISHNCF